MVTTKIRIGLPARSRPIVGAQDRTLFDHPENIEPSFDPTARNPNNDANQLVHLSDPSLGLIVFLELIDQTIAF